jgi:HEAT repeat protein
MPIKKRATFKKRKTGYDATKERSAKKLTGEKKLSGGLKKRKSDVFSKASNSDRYGKKQKRDNELTTEQQPPIFGDELPECAEQLGWNCFDVAIDLQKYVDANGKVGRAALVAYALANSSNVLFRNLLAPEIKHAAALTAVYMNSKSEMPIATKLGTKPDKLEFQQVDSSRFVSEPACENLEKYTLPTSMHTEELLAIVNDYYSAHDNMTAAVAKCNDELKRVEGHRLSLAELDVFFQDRKNRDTNKRAYSAFIRKCNKLYTPHETAFNNYCLSENVYRQYVEKYYGENHWFAFQRELGSTSMIDIAARMLNVVIVIYQGAEEIYRTQTPGIKTLDVEYNGFNHFYKLRLTRNSITLESDKERISSIWEEYNKTKTFSLQSAKDLTRLTRKYGGASVILGAVLTVLQNAQTDVQVKIAMSQTLKYAVKDGIKTEAVVLVRLLDASNDNVVRAEIIFALGYLLQHLDQEGERINPELVTNLQQRIDTMDDISPLARSFIQEQLREHCNLVNRDKYKTHTGTRYLGAVKRKALTITSKTQQTVKSTIKTAHTEEIKIDIQSIANALRGRKQSTHSHAEVTPRKVVSSKGSDQSWDKGTYSEVKTQYGKALSGTIIKDDEKDSYLPGKFLDQNAKWYCGSKIGFLLVDRMIGATFSKISLTQLLGQAAIAKLIQCLGNLDQLRQSIVGNIQLSDIISSGLFSYDYAWLPDNPNELERPITTKIRQLQQELEVALRNKTDTDELMRRVKSALYDEIDLIRVDAITAIYNCFNQTKSIIAGNPHYFQVIVQCLKDKNLKLKEYAIKIILGCEDAIDMEVCSEILRQCVNDLEQNLVKSAIDPILKYAEVPKLCVTLFDLEIILRISALLASEDLDADTKLKCCKVVFYYLENNKEVISKNKPMTRLLQHLLPVISGINIDSNLKYEALAIVFQIAEQKESLPQSVVDVITANLPNFEDNVANFAIIILGAVCESDAVTIRNVDNLSKWLVDDRVMSTRDGKISFEAKTEDNATSPCLAAIVAKIFARALAKGAIVVEQSLSDLTKALENSNEQTRIHVAKALFFASEKHFFPGDVLITLREYVTDKIPNIAIYISVAYTEGLKKTVSSKTSNSSKSFRNFGKNICC